MRASTSLSAHSSTTRTSQPACIELESVPHGFRGASPSRRCEEPRRTGGTPVPHMGLTRIHIAVLMVSAFASQAALAQAEKFDVRIWAIRATNKNTEISPELKSIAKELKARTKFTGFKLEKKSSGKVEAGKPFTAKLVGDYSGSITPIKRTKGRVKMKVAATRKVENKDKQLFKTTLTVDAGKFQLTALGKIPGSDDQLIMAASAK